MSWQRAIDPDMPWGWWLTRDGDAVIDEQGERWSCVRDVWWATLWPMDNARNSRSGCELMLRVLAAIAERGHLEAADIEAWFGGNHQWSKFYKAWLCEAGLTKRTVWRIVLTDLGQSVLKMLRVTRREPWQSLSLKQIWQAEAGGTTVSEEILARAEQIAAKWPRSGNRAFRDVIGELPAIKLTYHHTDTGVMGGMPLTRVVWSITFRDSHTRDLFFAWMCERSDHWFGWGRLAYGKGARALTERLIAIIIAEGASHGESWLKAGGANATTD